MKEWVKRGHHVGLFLALLFIVSFVWYWVRPVQQEFHMQMLELFFFGYTGMDVPGFFLGVIQSYVWGYIGVGLWCLAGYCCCCCKRS